MNQEQRKLERRYRLELGRLARLQKKNDLSTHGEFEFRRQLEITTAAKDALLNLQQRQYQEVQF